MYDKYVLVNDGRKWGNAMSKAYQRLCAVIPAVTPSMTTQCEEPFAGRPAVFVCNHAGAFGPIDMCAKFPLRDQCHTWMNAQMLDPKQVPAYVRQDYWWRPGSFFEPLLNATLPYIAAAVLPPILRLAPTVPVYHDGRVLTTMRQSLKWLKNGEHLVIFPEQPSGFQSHHSWINTGFLHIATMYYRATGQALMFYPVHVDYKRHVFQVARPIAFDTSRTLEEQQEELVNVLAKGLRGEK